jgi:hypothetical protein
MPISNPEKAALVSLVRGTCGIEDGREPAAPSANVEADSSIKAHFELDAAPQPRLPDAASLPSVLDSEPARLNGRGTMRRLTTRSKRRKSR